jgi:hypothetical protein
MELIHFQLLAAILFPVGSEANNIDIDRIQH